MSLELRRFIPVHDICRSYSPVFINILPAIHALTGCDSTSAFFGIGKKSVYTMVTDKGAHCFEALLFLGGQDEAGGIAAARKFIACLYDPKGKEISAHISMDILRAKFAAKRRDSSLAKLPPCEDSIRQHMRRASWQVRIWISSHIYLSLTLAPHYIMVGEKRKTDWSQYTLKECQPQSCCRICCAHAV